jgi:hypothetical protein
MSDEDFASIALYNETYGIGRAMRQQCQWEPDIVSRKQRGPPNADTEADPCGWIFESGHPGVVNQWGAKNTKELRRTTDGEETGVGAAAQWDESREMTVRRTPGRVNEISKLGHGLNESLVAPLQGVPHSLVPGPTIIGETLGSHEYVSQAWAEGSADESGSGETKGIEDAHDEEETDGERWKRLMHCENGRWMCMGCGGKPFSDRSTLRRHCRSSLHAKERDFRRCPFCPKEYLRSSHVNRHIRENHPEKWEKRARLRG